MLDNERYRIQIEGMRFCYGKTAIFRDFAFHSNNRVTLLRGPSGCGKTTFLKLLYGLLKPDSAGLWEMPEPAFLVLQSDTLVPWFSGRENIEKAYAGAGGPLVLRALAYAVEGDTGYVIGAFSREKGAPDVGKFTLTLRRDKGGRWLIMSDMDNGNTRPPRPPVPVSSPSR